MAIRMNSQGKSVKSHGDLLRVGEIWVLVNLIWPLFNRDLRNVLLEVIAAAPGVRRSYAAARGPANRLR